MSGWSFSHFSLARECAQKYKLVVLDGLPSGLETNGAVAFGTAIHAALNETLTGGDGALTFSILWEADQARNLDFGRSNWEKLADQGAGFLNLFAEKHAKRYKPFIAEKRLYSEYKGLKLEGTADFIGELGGVPTVADFKTASYRYNPQQTPISLQLHLYAYLAMQCTGYKPEQLSYIVFDKSNGRIQELNTPFNQNRLDELLDSMISYIQKMETNGDYPKDSKACIRGFQVCPFIKKCWGNE